MARGYQEGLKEVPGDRAAQSLPLFTLTGMFLPFGEFTATQLLIRLNEVHR